MLYRNEIIASTWLEDPEKRPTFAEIVQDLSNIHNFTDDTAESNGYISATSM